MGTVLTEDTVMAYLANGGDTCWFACPDGRDGTTAVLAAVAGTSAASRPVIRSLEVVLPTYDEAVAGEDGGGEEDGRLTVVAPPFPPAYETIFGDRNEVDVAVPRDGLAGRVDGEGETRVSDARGRSALVALDTEFKWTTLSVGLSVAVLVVLVLIVVIVAFPRSGHH